MFDIGVSHINPNGIPAPWPRLYELENVTNEFDLYLKDFLHAKNNLEDFNEAIIDKVKLFIYTHLN